MYIMKTRSQTYSLFTVSEMEAAKALLELKNACGVQDKMVTRSKHSQQTVSTPIVSQRPRRSVANYQRS
jgi:hypothetical protein